MLFNFVAILALARDWVWEPPFPVESNSPFQFSLFLFWGSYDFGMHLHGQLLRFKSNDEISLQVGTLDMAMLFTSPHGFSCRVFGFIRHPNTPVRCCEAHIVWLNREAGWRISEDRCRKSCAACFRNCCTVHPQFCFRSMPEKCLEIHIELSSLIGFFIGC